MNVQGSLALSRAAGVLGLAAVFAAVAGAAVADEQAADAQAVLHRVFVVGLDLVVVCGACVRERWF